MNVSVVIEATSHTHHYCDDYTYLSAIVAHCVEYVLKVLRTQASDHVKLVQLGEVGIECIVLL